MNVSTTIANTISSSSTSSWDAEKYNDFYEEYSHITVDNYEMLINELLEEGDNSEEHLMAVEDLIEKAWGLNIVEASLINNMNIALGSLEEKVAEARKAKKAPRKPMFTIVGDNTHTTVAPKAEVVAEVVEEVVVEESAPFIEKEEVIIDNTVVEVVELETEEVAEATQLAPEEVTMESMTIRYTNAQREIIETVLDNFEIEGLSVVMITRLKFDATFGQSLLTRLERLVNMNKRSINSLIKKLKVQLELTDTNTDQVDQEEQQVEEVIELTQQVETVVIEEAIEAAPQAAPQQVEEVTEAIIKADENDSIFDEFIQPPPTVKQPELPPMFSADFNEKMAAKRAAREAYASRPVDRSGQGWWANRNKGAALVSTTDTHEQYVAEPIDMSDW